MRLVPTAAVFALLFPVPVPAADYAAGVKSKVVLKTTVTASGEKIRYPVTDRPQVTAAEVEIAPGAVTGNHEHPGPVYALVISGPPDDRGREGSDEERELIPPGTGGRCYQATTPGSPSFAGKSPGGRRNGILTFTSWFLITSS